MDIRQSIFQAYHVHQILSIASVPWLNVAYSSAVPR